MLTQVLIRLFGVQNYFRFKQCLVGMVERKLLNSPKISYSQFGEDMVLNAYFSNEFKGFYVDIGAYHPIELSNTFHFYKMGWRGINIDPTPGVMKRFDEMRPEDINVECAVGSIEREIDFYEFDMRAINTANLKGVQYAKEIFNNDPKKIVRVKSKPLARLLDEYLPNSSTEIDFMTVDVEGADEEVLRSNNWEKYRPKYICVEDHSSMDKVQSSSVSLFLNSVHYEIIGRVGPTNFYVSRK